MKSHSKAEAEAEAEEEEEEEEEDHRSRAHHPPDIQVLTIATVNNTSPHTIHVYM